MNQTIITDESPQVAPASQRTIHVGSAEITIPPDESPECVECLRGLSGTAEQVGIPMMENLDRMADQFYRENRPGFPDPQRMYADDLIMRFAEIHHSFEQYIQSLFVGPDATPSQCQEAKILFVWAYLEKRAWLYSRMAMLYVCRSRIEHGHSSKVFFDAFLFFYQIRRLGFYAMALEERFPSLRVKRTLERFERGELQIVSLLRLLDPRPAPHRPKQYPFPGEARETFEVRRLESYLTRYWETFDRASTLFPSDSELQSYATHFLSERIPFKVFDDHKSARELAVTRAAAEGALNQRGGHTALSCRDDCLTVEAVDPPTPETTRKRYKANSKTAVCVWCKQEVATDQMHPTTQECRACHELREEDEAVSNPRKAELRARCPVCGGQISARICQSCGIAMPDGTPSTLGTFRPWAPTYPTRASRHPTRRSGARPFAIDPPRYDRTGQLAWGRPAEPPFCRKCDRAVHWETGCCPNCGGRPERKDARKDALRLARTIFGRKLKELRGARGISLEQLATRSGVKAATLAAMEADDSLARWRMPHAGPLARLALALGVDVSDLTPASKAIAELSPVTLQQHFESRGAEKFHAGAWPDEDGEPRDDAFESHTARYRAPIASAAIQKLAHSRVTGMEATEDDAGQQRTRQLQAAAILDYALQQWGDRAAAFVRKVYIEDQTQREAAAAVGISEDMGRSYLVRLKLRFQDATEEKHHAERRSRGPIGPEPARRARARRQIKDADKCMPRGMDERTAVQGAKGGKIVGIY